MSTWNRGIVSLRIGACAAALATAAVVTTALASVQTNQWFYSWGDTVAISGGGMAAAETVTVDVDNPDGSLAQEHVTTATSTGTFSDSWVVPTGSSDGIYTVVATGQTSAAVFTTTFDPGACSIGDPTQTHCAPSTLAATAASTTEIDLSWIDNSTNEDSFDLQRSLSSSFTGPTDVTVPCLPNPNSGKCNGYHNETVSYPDTGLQSCTTYYYRVRAVATNEQTGTTVYSLWSNSAWATTLGTNCGPTSVTNGSLTMGFWQNKNGQAIIKSYCDGAGSTSLAAFLTSYNPIKDMTATTCNGEAAYVYNVVKSASAGGASMNAMLKAQMLATALDVYFTDPTLGGNRIGASSPVGGFPVDLTKVCPSITPGTCTVAYENTGAAFGAPPASTCQLVADLLAYAASQSNAGGSIWYGQVKATQGLAKDTFDAVNNQVAVTC